MGALVTGTGGLGSYIARHFISQGVSCSLYGTARQIDAVRQIVDASKIRIFKGDILDVDSLNNAVRESGADRIIHTAGPRATQTRKDPKYCVRVHIQGTLNVLEAARKANLDRVVFSSSGSVYLATKKGQQAKGSTIKEDDVLVPMARARAMMKDLRSLDISIVLLSEQNHIFLPSIIYTMRSQAFHNANSKQR